MKPRVNFVFCVHNHQPVGNFEHVFEEAFENAYRPFLDAVEACPWFKFCAHFSGPLLEWIQERRPRFLERLRALREQGRLELLGGGFYEPILCMLPEEDIRGQLQMMSDHLLATFGARPDGIWMTERVWEQALTRTLVDAGVRYTVLDDFHFKAAGLRDNDLVGSFLTEDQGRLLRVFPIREALRYAIPYKEPHETVDFLLRDATPDGTRTIVYADDGEKFGVWPGTHHHVYRNGWLARFLQALEARRDEIRAITFREALEHEPVGKVYLPACSYREMGEWTLPAHAQEEYQRLVEQMRGAGTFEKHKAFLVGGSWRNFKMKYPEANRMYGRMLSVSRKVQEAGRPRDAARELYRAQCNCAYWHGVFGGIYLPFLRDAVYRHLIAAESHLPAKDLFAEPVDLDLDGVPEIRLSNGCLNVFVAPRHGGSIVELDLLEWRINLQATFARRYEHYHSRLAQAAHAPRGVQTIHEIVVSKVPNIERYRQVDPHERHSLMDRLDDFATGAYQAQLAAGDSELVLILSRRNHRVSITKTIRLRKGESALHVSYRLRNESGVRLQAPFGIEFNVSMLNPAFPDSYVHTGDDVPASPLTASAEYTGRVIGVRDRSRGVTVLLEVSREARFSIEPIQTISMSDGGFELVWQSTAIAPTWSLALEPAETFEVNLVERFG